MIRNIAYKNHSTYCKNQYYDELNSQSSLVLKTQLEFTELYLIKNAFMYYNDKIVKMTKILLFIDNEN